MKKVIITTMLFVACATVGYARPTLGLGIKLMRNMESWGTFYSLWDGTTYVDWDREWFWGIGGDLLISFTKHITLRMGAIEFNLISNRRGEGNGGSSINVFSNLNADMIFILPVGRRVSPLVFAGLTYERFMNKPNNDLRNPASPYNIRLGLGGQYTVGKKTRLLLDIQMWDKRQSEVYIVPEISGMGWDIWETLGIIRMNLGVHYEL